MTQRTYGGREDILGADDRLEEDVFVPELNNQWYKIRGLSGAERERYEASLVYMNKSGRWQTSMKGTAMARLVALSVVDADGKRVFSDEDVQAISRKNAAGLSKIATVARKLSGLTEEDIEELEGNSDGDQSGNGSSSSHSLSVAPSPNSSTESPVAS